MTAQQDEWVGKVLGSQFKLTERLGAGGMGTVYLAEQIDVGRQVVVKLLNPEYAALDSDDATQRFRREARAVARLNHPNIVQLYVFGQVGADKHYIAMEYVEGVTLSDLRKELGLVPEPRALRITDQILSALIEAHTAGIVHRDLKPDNVMLTERHGTRDYVKVLDFGVAKMVGGEAALGESTITAAGNVSGTPKYMAPEQARGHRVDQRTDLYAMGLILYEMLTGLMPFDAEGGAMEYIVLHATEPPALPTKRAPEAQIQPRTEALIMKALAKPKDERWQSAAEMQREVRRILRTYPDAIREFPTPHAGVEPNRAPSDTANSRSDGPPPKTPIWPFILLGILLWGAAGGGVWWWWTQNQAAEQKRDAGSTVTVAGDTTGSVDPVESDAAVEPDPELDAGATIPEADVLDDPEPEAPDAAPAPEPDVQGASEPDILAEPDADPAVAPAADAEPTTPLKDDFPRGSAPTRGADVEGFPAPVKSEFLTNTDMALVFLTDHAPIDVVEFYRQVLPEKHGKVEPMANGLRVLNPRSSISFVSVSRYQGRTMVSISKNALVAEVLAPDAGSKPFGVELMEGMRRQTKMDNMEGFTTDDAYADVGAFYKKRYGSLDGVMVTENETGQGFKQLVIMMPKGDTPWRMLTIMVDPLNKNRTQLMVFKR